MNDLYAKLFRSMLLPTIEALSGRQSVVAHLGGYEANQWRSLKEIRAIQLGKLNALLEHSWNTVPFLREHWSNAGVKWRPLQDIAELSRYPVLTKIDITRNADRMVSTAWRGRTLSKTTGGSTGQPLRIEFTPESDVRRRAVMWRGYKWAGADIGTRSVFLWGMSQNTPRLQGLKESIYHGAYNRVMLDSFGMRSDNLAHYASALAAAKPSVVVGYVSPLRTLARWALESGTALFQPKSILSAAEGLGPTDRELLERAFRAPVFNTYGCREVMLISSECELHNLHANEDHLVVETTTTDGVPLLDESGQILLTDLHNYAMPLVRYVNGDMAVSSSRTCACGRGLPLLERIDGRILDAIRTPDGRLLPGEFFIYIFKDFLFVREFQVIQETLDMLKVVVVPNGEVSPAMWGQVKQAIINRTGDSLGIDIEIAADIARTPSGKLRVTVSKLGSPPPAVG